MSGELGIIHVTIKYNYDKYKAGKTRNPLEGCDVVTVLTN